MERAPAGTRPSARSKYEFGWDILDVIIGGKSTIDSPGGFLVSSTEEATAFVRAYGYDLDNPIENAELLGNFHESLDFIRRYFLKPENPDGLKLEIPRKILEMTDIRDLFVYASVGGGKSHGTNPTITTDTTQSPLRNWACAILKVMHTIAHVDKDVRSPYFVDVQKQIFDRYYRLVQRVHGGEAGQLYLGEREDDPLRVDLVSFETKPKKSRDSTLLKMLHKPENVAEDIFDRVGIRFITKTRLDCLRVIKFLKERMIVVPPNIKPSRSRNTLIDVESFRARVGEQMEAYVAGELDETRFADQLDQALHGMARGESTSPASEPANPHSSEFYRAIQFTARQLVKFRNPLFDELRDLRNLVRAKGTSLQDEELKSAAERIDLKYVQREVRFFYPYEIQLMDKHSAEENEKGASAHREYKKAQVQTALKRVMGSLI